MTQIVFRVDASLRIGTGHVVRCLTLADELERLGARCRFISRAHPGHMIDIIRSRGYEVASLAAPREFEACIPEGEYTQWLAVTQEQDVSDTVRALSSQRPDWLILDHYALDKYWEVALRPHVGSIAVIDDLANRIHAVDLLIDQNYSIEGSKRYDGLLPERSLRLCGPKYALIRPVYSDYRAKIARRTSVVKRVMVFFGGVDSFNLTEIALHALSSPALAHLAVDVVVAANHPYRVELERLAASRQGVTIYGPRAHLADLMTFADLGLGAGGGTTWERFCLGLPSVVVSIAENQRPACRALSRDGFISYGGHWDEIDSQSLVAALTDSIRDPCWLRSAARICWSLVDGQGARRVATYLLATEKSEL